MALKMHRIIFFQEKVVCLPKIFRTVTRNTWPEANTPNPQEIIYKLYINTYKQGMVSYMKNLKIVVAALDCSRIYRFEQSAGRHTIHIFKKRSALGVNC